MVFGALQQDQLRGRPGPLPHLLDGRGALGDLSGRRLGAAGGRGTHSGSREGAAERVYFLNKRRISARGKEELARIR